MKLTDKLRKEAEAQGINTTCWDNNRPHFQGIGPHRYTDPECIAANFVKTNSEIKLCCYCLRPENYESKVKSTTLTGK